MHVSAAIVMARLAAGTHTHQRCTGSRERVAKANAQQSNKASAPIVSASMPGMSISARAAASAYEPPEPMAARGAGGAMRASVGRVDSASCAAEAL